MTSNNEVPTGMLQETSNTKTLHIITTEHTHKMQSFATAASRLLNCLQVGKGLKIFIYSLK